MSTLANSSIKVQGQDAVALRGKQIAGATSALAFANSTIEASGGTAMEALGGTTNFSFEQTSVVSRTLLHTGFSGNANAATVSVKATNGSYLEGDATIDGNNTKRATLTPDDSVLRGSLTSFNDISLSGRSRWMITGSSSADALNVSDSEIEFDAAVPYKTLTVGNLATNGGTFILNTKLNAGGDATETDRIVVTGDTSGSGFLRIVNNGGTGAPTVEGIRIIEVGGASNGTFTLLSDYKTKDGQNAVVSGAYAYTLHKNGIATPADGDWYLRSQLNPVDPVKPIDPVDPVKPVDPNELSQPLYQAGAPVYEAYPQALLGLNGVSTLQQHVGNRMWAGSGNRVIAQGADPVGTPYAPAEEAGVAIEGNGIWGRIEGGYNRMDGEQSTTGVDYRQGTFRMQAGIDGLLTENEGGKLLGGISIHYVNGSTKTASAHDTIEGGGEISTDGYGLGGTLTWYGENGSYLDAQGQATWHRSDLSYGGGRAALAKGNDGFGYALLLEGGRRIAIDPEWSVTSQAQLIYSRVRFDDFTAAAYGSSVSLDKGDSLQGRFGVTLDHETSWQNAAGMMDRAHVYGIANLYYEFLKGTQVTVDNVAFANRNDRLWGGIGAGGSYSWDDDKYSIYGEGLVNTSLNNVGDSYSFKGNVGFRVKW